MSGWGLVVEFAPAITAAEQAVIRQCAAFLVVHAPVVHGRTVFTVGEAELHLAGQGPGVDLDRQPRIHQRVVLIGERAFYLFVDDDGCWTAS